jgi:NAD(P)-dependent dehydrogenase (short-subunit alcohol dehydrogenase family)
MALLSGQRAVVTGGGSGIGAETCRRTAAEGAQVAVLDLDGDRAEAVAKEIDAISFAVDVTDYDAVSAAMRDAAEHMHGLSILYNNAGGGTLSPIHDYEVAEWRRIVDLDLTGVFHGFKAGAPLILRTGGGSIVSSASISGTRPAAGEAPYAPISPASSPGRTSSPTAG